MRVALLSDIVFNGKHDVIKKSVSFNQNDLSGSNGMLLPCRHCLGCRLDYARDWAIRAVHEASFYSANCFITLTYSPEHLPADRSIHVKEMQDFFKRLIDAIKPIQIRRLYCGEYGTLNDRPHYHAIIFGYDFPDKYPFYRSKSGFQVYRSPLLEKVWPYGISSIGSFTYQSAGYVSRYVMKKVYGDDSDSHYQGREREFLKMSNKPGIGNDWIEKYWRDVFPHNFLVLKDGKKAKVPRFYLKWLKKNEPDVYGEVNERATGVNHYDFHLESDQAMLDYWKRQEVCEQVLEHRANRLIRSYEYA